MNTAYTLEYSFSEKYNLNENSIVNQHVCSILYFLKKNM